MSCQTEMHQVVLKRPNGSLTSTVRTQAIGLHSRRIDADQDAALAIFMRLLLEDASNNRFQKFARTGLGYDAWSVILSFAIGFNPKSLLSDRLLVDDEYPCTRQLGALAICLRKPTLFPAIKMHPNYIIEAALHADEEMVLKIIAADPRYLTQIGTGIDLQGNPFTGTPLQAALRTTDIEMCDKLKPYFAQIENGEAEMHRQIKEIYTKSLNRYLDILPAALKKLEAEQFQLLQLDALSAAQTRRCNEVVKKIKKITRSIVACKSALEKNDIHEILEAHNQAQEANAFDFEPYVNAICAIDLNDPVQKQLLDDVMELINATTPAATAASIARTGVSATQTDAARAKSFDQLTLVEELNHFREEFVSHTKPEIIFNPHHILTGLKHNETTWHTLPHASDPEYKMRSVIFSQLVGWAQRNAAEPVRQDIRQGTYYLTEENEPRSRPSRFNTWDSVKSKVVHNSLVDASLIDVSSFGGLGYKFAV